MATGDVKNNLKKLQRELKKMRFPGVLDWNSIVTGKWEAFQEIYQNTFRHFSPLIAEEIHNKFGFYLDISNSIRFSECLYRIFRDLYQYKPPITRSQILSNGFVERKIIMCTEVLQMIQERHIKLSGQNVSKFRSSNSVKYPVKQTASDKSTNIPPVKITGTMPTSSVSASSMAIPHNKRRTCYTSKESVITTSILHTSNSSKNLKEHIPLSDKRETEKKLCSQQSPLPMKKPQHTRFKLNENSNPTRNQTNYSTFWEFEKHTTKAVQKMIAQLALLESRMAIMENKLQVCIRELNSVSLSKLRKKEKFNFEPETTRELIRALVEPETESYLPFIEFEFIEFFWKKN